MTRSFFSAFAIVALSASACTADPEPAHPPKPVARASAGASWSKPTEAELRETLTSLQFRVTQEDGTERAFSSDLHDNQEPGIYVDIVSGEPLFAHAHKFDSGTGWPSFYQPLVTSNVHTDTDYKLGYARTEVRSVLADSHLGHVFPDGPDPTGLRYCINAAALRFVPLDAMEEEGYGEYVEFARK